MSNLVSKFLPLKPCIMFKTLISSILIRSFSQKLFDFRFRRPEMKYYLQGWCHQPNPNYQIYPHVCHQLSWASQNCVCHKMIPQPENNPKCATSSATISAKPSIPECVTIGEQDGFYHIKQDSRFILV